MPIHRRSVLAGTAAGLVLPRPVLAQFGRSTVRLVVGFPPGGSGDVFARLAANGLSEELKQTVIVDNRAGAGGLTAAEHVLRATPDGLTLISHTGSSAITAPICKKVPPYDAVKDFAWIAHMTAAPFVVAINPKLPVTDLKSFVDYAKAEGGRMTYGSAGVGTTVHLASEAFKEMTGIKAVHVPYRGSAPAIIDAMAGGVAFLFETIGTLLPYHKAGTLRILALFDGSRSGLAPDIPTGKESGVDFVSGTPNLLAAPPKTPSDIVEAYAKAARAVMSKKALQEQLIAQGITPITDSDPQKARAYVAAEIARLQPLVDKLGIAT